jgi:putative nucleotidyltransferase with HDIG domain
VPTPASPTHLVRRFFAVLTARPLTAEEQVWVGGLLGDEAHLFWSQPAADQRHAADAARWVADRRPDRRDLARAALLHDIGKRHARLGPFGRTFATVASLLALRRPVRFVAYRDHGPIGAEELRRGGVEDVVVAFARHHHGNRPGDVPTADWELLAEADHLT